MSVTSERLGGARLVVDDVSHWFSAAVEPATVLARVNLTIAAGEFITIVGRSGCGKSTLLNIIAGLVRPRAGTVRIDAPERAERLPTIGYITQHDSLLPWRNARENAAFPLELHGVAKAQRLERADALLHRVGLGDFTARLPHELSGGMRQRLALARTLIYQPRVLLMDEPFGALDAQTRLMLHDLLLELWRETGTTIVFVTHDILEAIALGDRLVTLSAHPGRVRSVYDVGVARPRQIAALHADPAAAALFAAVSADLGVAPG